MGLTGEEETEGERKKKEDKKTNHFFVSRSHITFLNPLSPGSMPSLRTDLLIRQSQSSRSAFCSISLSSQEEEEEAEEEFKSNCNKKRPDRTGHDGIEKSTRGGKSTEGGANTADGNRWKRCSTHLSASRNPLWISSLSSLARLQ